jgi:hypothetical protein
MANSRLTSKLTEERVKDSKQLLHDLEAAYELGFGPDFMAGRPEKRRTFLAIRALIENSALLDQREPAPDAALPDAERARMVELLDVLEKEFLESESYPGAGMAFEGEPKEREIFKAEVQAIRALILSAPAPRKVTPEFITEFARSLIGRTTTERVDLLRDLFAELGVRVEEAK